MVAFLRNNTFDDIRWFFCLSLVCFHFSVANAITPFWFVTGKEVVSAFFILSGMFTYKSFQYNPSISQFYKRRAQRILPPYILIIIFLFIIGAFFYSGGVINYLKDIESWRYLGANVLFLNFLQPTLSDLFSQNPLAVVNASLWTMKVEIAFYLLLPFLVWCIRRKALMTLVLLYIFSVLYNIICVYSFQKTGHGIYLTLQHQIVGELMYFVAGMACQHYFKKLLQYKKWLFPLSFLVVVIYHFTFSLLYLMPIALALVLLMIGSFRSFLPSWKRYNLTYEIYLIHFPIIQLFLVFGSRELHPVISFIIVLLTVFLLAYFLRRISQIIIVKR